MSFRNFFNHFSNQHKRHNPNQIVPFDISKTCFRI